MLPFKLVYSDGYDLNLGNHIFPSVKFKLIRERCLAEGVAGTEDFIEPQPASDEDVLRVHTREWVEKLKKGRLAPWEELRMEVPYSPQLVRAVWLSAGGSLLAARRALADGCGFNLGGGFHHAYPDHGEGFCALNDVAVAIRALQAEGAIATAMVVDLDVHHGNGTAAIFAGDPSVFTLSMHQESNYPHPKPPSDLDVGLDDFTGDGTYLRLLGEALTTAFERFAKNSVQRAALRLRSLRQAQGLRSASTGQASNVQRRDREAGASGLGGQGKVGASGKYEDKPDLIFYLAGADPYVEDQLGGLAISMDGLQERDRMVIEAARTGGIPIAITFAGGYAHRVGDTVQIHVNTIVCAREAFKNLKPRINTDEHR